MHARKIYGGADAPLMVVVVRKPDTVVYASVLGESIS